jgi:hypothetical protein
MDGNEVKMILHVIGHLKTIVNERQHFGVFEMRGDEELKLDQFYQNWMTNIEQKFL